MPHGPHPIEIIFAPLFYLQTDLSKVDKFRCTGKSSVPFYRDFSKGLSCNLRSFDCHLKGRDTRCDKSLRHVAATGCRNKSALVTCENSHRCDRILSLRSVARIQTGLNSCDISQRQNESKRLCRSSSADEATCRRPRAAYTVRVRPKGVPFSGFRYMKG